MMIRIDSVCIFFLAVMLTACRNANEQSNSVDDTHLTNEPSTDTQADTQTDPNSIQRQDYVVVRNNSGKRQFMSYIAMDNGSFQEDINTPSVGAFIPDATGRDTGYFADVNGDGRQDYVVIWNNGGKRQFATYITNANGTFQEFITTSSDGSYISDSVGRDTGYFADMNGDGRQDYIVVWNNAGQRRFATYITNANGTFQEFVTTPSDGSYITDSAGRDTGYFADVNGDGRADYVVVWNNAGKRWFSTYISNNNATFQEFISTPSDGSYMADSTGRDTGYFADVNGDGRPDYIVVWNNAGQRRFATYITNANGTFQEFVTTPSDGSYITDSVGRDTGYFADITGDGLADYVVVWNNGGSRQFATYIANTNGTFQEYVNTLSSGSFISDSIGRDLGGFADVAGGTQEDYVVVWSDRGTRQFATYISNGNGTFREYINTSSTSDFIADSYGRDLGSFAEVTTP